MANGFFLGGAQTGIKQERAGARASRGLDIQEKSSQENIRLRSQGLQLQERQVKNAEQRDITARVDKAVADSTKFISDSIDDLLAAGKDQETISKQVKPLVDDVIGIFDRSGRDSTRFVSQIQAMISGPTPVEIAAGTGRATVAGQVAQVEALGEAGISPAQARETAGIKTPKAVNIQTTDFQMPSGEFLTVRSDDALGIRDAIAAGGVTTKRSVVAQDIGGLGSVTGFSKGDISETRKQVQSIGANLEEGELLLKAFEKNREAAGVTGAVIDTVGGLIQQFPAGEQILKAINISPEKTTEVRTQSIFFAARMLETITGDKSGRYSDEEQQRSAQALKTMIVSASFPQIKAALTVGTDILSRDLVRQVDQLVLQSGLTDDDLRTKEGMRTAGAVLMKNGLTRKIALQAVRQLRARRGIVGVK